MNKYLILHTGELYLNDKINEISNDVDSVF